MRGEEGALSKFAFIGQPEYFRFIYENDLSGFAEVREFPFTFNMNVDDFKELLEFNADFNFFFRGEFVPDLVLYRLRGIKICFSSEPFPNIVEGRLNLSRDSYCRYKQFKRIALKQFDYLFHYDASSMQFFESEKFNLSGFFPLPVATGVYKKIDLKKKWDLFFVGRSTSHREKLFLPLKHQYNFLHICHGIWGSDLVQYVNQCKILLNVHAENEISWEPRLQMLMATGNLVISEKISTNTILVPGKDYVEITTEKELLDACEYYLHHENERDLIAKNGQETIKNKLDSKNNLKNFTSDIISGVYPKFFNKNIPPRNYKLEVISILVPFFNKFHQLLVEKNRKI